MIYSLEDSEIRAIAPSVFAANPIAGVSDRYTFLPTSAILDGMRDNGWMPVRVKEQRVRTEERQGFQKHVIHFQRADHIGKTMDLSAMMAWMLARSFFVRASKSMSRVTRKTGVRHGNPERVQLEKGTPVCGSNRQ